MKSFLTNAVSLIVFVSVFSQTAHASEYLSISPHTSDITLSENSQELVQLKVSNTSKSDMQVFLSVIDFGTLDNTGGVVFLGDNSDGQNERGLAKWVTLDTDSALIEAGSSRDFTATITNSDEMSPGGHYGAVMITTTDLDEESDLNVRQALTSLLIVKKLGGEKVDLKLENSSLLQKNIFSFPSSMKLTFKNAGNVHTIPRGYYELYDTLGNYVAGSIINEGSFYVMPGLARQFTSGLSYAKLPSFPGKYTLKLYYRSDAEAVFSEHKLQFVYINLRPFVYIIFGLLASSVLVKRVLKNRSNRKVV